MAVLLPGRWLPADGNDTARLIDQVNALLTDAMPKRFILKQITSALYLAKSTEVETLDGDDSIIVD